MNLLPHIDRARAERAAFTTRQASSARLDRVHADMCRERSDEADPIDVHQSYENGDRDE